MHSTMTIRELLTYLMSLPKDSVFPVGLGAPFILNKLTDQIIFRPKLFATVSGMQTSIESLFGLEVRSNTGARGVIHPDLSYANFGIDETSIITPLNLVTLTLLRAMETTYKEVRVGFRHSPFGQNLPGMQLTLRVPRTWWDSLTTRHQQSLACEYLNTQLMGGVTFEAIPHSLSGLENVTIVDAFGAPIAFPNAFRPGNSDSGGSSNNQFAGYTDAFGNPV